MRTVRTVDTPTNRTIESQDKRIIATFHEGITANAQAQGGRNAITKIKAATVPRRAVPRDRPYACNIPGGGAVFSGSACVVPGDS